MRILIAAALLFVLAAVGLVAAPYVVAWEGYRSDIEAAFEKATGHKVKIKGPVDVTFLPRPVLMAKDVSIVGETDRESGFDIKSQQVDVGFRMGPLMVGRPIVDQLKLTRPQLILDQQASDGITSWPPQIDEWASVFLPPGLRSMTIDDGRLHLERTESSATPSASDISLTIVRTADNGPVETAGLFKTHHHRFSIAAEFGGQSNDGSSTIKMEIGAQNGVDETTTLKLNGVLKRHGQDASLRGKIDLAGPDLRSGLKAISAMADFPSAFLSLAPDQSFRIETRFQATRNLLASEKAKITLNGKFGSGEIAIKLDPKPNLELDIDLPTIQLADDTALVDFVPLDLLSVFPTTPGEIKINLREMIYRKKAIRRTAISILTDSSGVPQVERAKMLLPGLVDVHFKGRLRPSESGRVLSGQLTSAGDNLGETIRWLGMPLVDQGQGWRAFNLESDVSISNVEVSLSTIDMRIDSSKIGGSAKLRFSERLILGLDIDVERLNLDLYTNNEGSATELVELLSNQFEQLDSSIDARFRRLSWQGLRFKEASLSASVEQQHFKLDTLALQTVGSTEIIVEGEVDLKTDAVDLTTEFKSEFPTRVMRHLNLQLPLASARLMPLTLSGWVTGRLDGFDTGLRADYDNGQWLIEGRAGWIEDRAYYDLTVRAEHPDHQILASHFGLAPLVPTNDAPGPFEVEGHLRYNQDGHWITAGSAKLGPTSITGRLTHEDVSERGKWDARISIGNPREDSLAPFLTLVGYRSTGKWTPDSILGRLPQTAVRTAWLNNFDGSLSLAARGGLAGDGINVSARLNEGFLYVDELEADLWNGDLTAALSLERRREQPFASIAIELDDIETEALTDWLGMPKTIEGPLDLELNAASVGLTLFDMVKGISGNISFKVQQGQLHSTGIPRLRKQLRDKLSTNPEKPTAPEDPLKMPLSNFTASGTLKRGIATLNEGNFTFDPSLGFDAQATIGGSLDLLLWIAELTLDITTGDDTITPLALQIVGSPKRPQGFFKTP